MKLADRIRAEKSGGRSGSGSAIADQDAYNQVKNQIHMRLVERLDTKAIADLSDTELEISVKNALNELTLDQALPLNALERDMLIADLVNEITGFGPLEIYLNDDSVQDILVNGPSQVLVEKSGRLYTTPVKFRDNAHLLHVIDKIVSGVGRRIDESSPMVDARLPDGSRVNVIIPPLALDGPAMSIRKFGKYRFTREDLFKHDAVSPAMMSFLEAAIKARLNILVSGGTGAGKTTLLNVLSSCIPDDQRIITIEDSAELRLDQPQVVRLESRPPNVEGKGEVTLTDLVKNSLRMRPDRIIVGETRGGEVMDMLQAMNTGHPGSMSTVHANSPADALSRMSVMATMSPMALPEKAMQALMASAVDLIVQLSRMADGTRKVVSVTEISGVLENDRIFMQELFTYQLRGRDEKGNVLGAFSGCAVIPRAMERIRAHGLDLDTNIFSGKEKDAPLASDTKISAPNSDRWPANRSDSSAPGKVAGGGR